MARFKRHGFADHAFYTIITLYLLVALLAVVIPLLNVLSSSVSSPTAVVTGKVTVFPRDLFLGGYTAVLESREVGQGYINSIIYTALGTVFALVLTSIAGYVLSRMDLWGRSLFAFLFLLPMLFQGGIIPTYLLMKNLGILDTRLVMILHAAINPYYVLIAVSYFRNQIPSEILDASRIDGASNIQFLVRVVVPLSKPILAVITLWVGVQHWNNYFAPLMFLKSNDLFPLTIVLRNMISNYQLSADEIASIAQIEAEEASELMGLTEVMKYSLIVVGSLPMIALYPFVQKHFVKGVTVGSLKG